MHNTQGTNCILCVKANISLGCLEYLIWTRQEQFELAVVLLFYKILFPGINSHCKIRTLKVHCFLCNEISINLNLFGQNILARELKQHARVMSDICWIFLKIWPIVDVIKCADLSTRYWRFWRSWRTLSNYYYL